MNKESLNFINEISDKQVSQRKNGAFAKCLLKILLLALCLALAVCTAGCKNKSDSEENDEIPEIDESENDIDYSGDREAYDSNKELVIKLGFSTDESDPRGIASAKFKEIVERDTKGRIKIEIYPNSTLGSDAELIAGVVSGDVDMTMSSAGNFAAYAMRMGISAMPFLFDNFEQAWAFMDGETQREISDDLLEYNVYVLGYFDNGFRCITTSERTGAINSVDDIKGLTIRTPENAVVMETMSQLGANPKVLAFSKLYEALQSGSFDAQENPIPIIYNSGFYKVQKYMAVTNHSYDAMPFVIRKDLWDMLMTSEQNILKNAALEAQNLNRSLVKAQTEEYISKLKDNGMIITYPNLNEFKYATSGVYDYFRPVFGDELISKVKTVSQ